jgi:hypothetical protein
MNEWNSFREVEWAIELAALSEEYREVLIGHEGMKKAPPNTTHIYWRSGVTLEAGRQMEILTILFSDRDEKIPKHELALWARTHSGEWYEDEDEEVSTFLKRGGWLGNCWPVSSSRSPLFFTDKIPKWITPSQNIYNRVWVWTRKNTSSERVEDLQSRLLEHIATHPYL